MPSIVAVNPFKCRMWGLHDRLDTHINEETCRAEIESFLRHGQLVPVLGRRLNGDPGHEIELIYGARRLFVARHINKPLLAELRELSDRDALIAMDIENRERVDISPYERGMSYVRWIFEGHFKTQEDLAKGLRVSASQVSRLLKLARMPSVIVAAFENPTEIRESWGLELIDACEDPQRRDRLLREARSIARMRPRLTATEVYRNLQTACACGRRVRSSSHDRVVKDTGGAPLFRLERFVFFAGARRRLVVLRRAELVARAAQSLER